MFKSTIVVAPAIILAACAYVPDFENESTFSFAEILNQVACELYVSGEDLRLQPNRADDGKGPYAFPTFKPDEFAAKVEIEPGLTVQAGVGITTALQDSTKSIYRKWGLSNVYPGNGDNYSVYGEATGTQAYNIPLSSLYLRVRLAKAKNGPYYLENVDVDDATQTREAWTLGGSCNVKVKGTSATLTMPTIRADQTFDKDKLCEVTHNPDVRISGATKAYKAVVDPYSPTYDDPSKQVYFLLSENEEEAGADPARKYDPSQARNWRMISRQLVNLCQALPAGASPFERGLGLQDFLERTIASTENHITSTTSAVYEKEYKQTVSLGVTLGWYFPRGSDAPAAGASKQIDDKLTITFTPAPPPPTPTPTPVYVVARPVKPTTTKSHPNEISPEVQYRLDSASQGHKDSEIKSKLDQLLQ
jgi:hypothetical protein